ncbi:hypothetical protein NMY22_g5556 [Coprinellus aureogranulatus]|nr:hypothetical protein NMY22_g5556 [Coprinellus aureogranulatus]
MDPDVLLDILQDVRNWPLYLNSDVKTCNALRIASFEFGFFWSLRLYGRSLLDRPLSTLPVPPERAVFVGNFICGTDMSPVSLRFRTYVDASQLSLVQGQVLGWFANVRLVIAVAPHQTLSELGYSCHYQITNPSLRAKIVMGNSCISLVTSACFLILGLWAFMKKYRESKVSFIKVLFREGALYYIPAVVLSFMATLRGRVIHTNSTSDNTLAIIIQYGQALIPMFAERILINGQQADEQREMDDQSSILRFSDSYEADEEELWKVPGTPSISRDPTVD